MGVAIMTGALVMGIVGLFRSFFSENWDDGYREASYAAIWFCLTGILIIGMELF